MLTVVPREECNSSRAECSPQVDDFSLEDDHSREVKGSSCFGGTRVDRVWPLVRGDIRSEDSPVRCSLRDMCPLGGRSPW